MAAPFHKMHGLGNDFVVIDARTEPVAMTAARARAIADRRTGIGCDQLILLEPSAIADIKMRIFNADGSVGEQSRAFLQKFVELFAGWVAQHKR
jgi:diaminopimelate epimerase